MPSAGRPPEDRSVLVRFRALASVVAAVVLGLAITAAVTVVTYQRERADARAETDALLVNVGASIDRQVSRYAEALYGLRADFGRTPGLSRQGFDELVNIDDLVRRNPGADSVTFNRLVPDSALARFTARTRREVPGFRVYPVVRGADHVIVDYVASNRRSLPEQGLDIAADPVRRAAYLFARDSGELSATRPLSLVQDPTGPGFLLMLAAYDVNPVPLTTPARMRHFIGVLVAVFSADTMIEQAVETRARLTLSIYDAGPTVATPRARPRRGDWLVGAPTPDYTEYADIDVGSRRWRLVTAEPILANQTATVAAATTGLALTLLVAGTLAAMALSRRRAWRLAQAMTTSLRLSQDRLQATNESMRGFIDVAAHDLRSPLVSISGFSALLNDERLTLSEEDRRRAAEAIERQTQHMSRLIDDLLTMSSIDGGGMLPRPETVVLADAVAEALESAAGAAVTVDCPPGTLVRADPHQLRRILDNYLQNALKYGRAPVRVEAETLDGLVEIRVLDAGPGVPAEFAPRLFDKFARADRPAGSDRPGTGLGLSIVRGLAEANGGEADYRRVEPHGSCFIVRLPAAPPA